ncbi:5-oxoprolinase [Bombyx mandarina]|uniref:5-oxoprolinase n=1 Tax=Bombyx mandarina TaxID=7092 RepID=A0A6J2JJR9_BOMMA|nr:5-oxoprolinase [Bombyx mandarina]XP_028029519.1 5-oxoprolinase [Bombyx mandarina]XP_028029520.1 5-oxoprolinase [Bombyx mandarina]XP_028029521.1 5-oxoprolinase [Bombyx mandarina]
MGKRFQFAIDRGGTFTDVYARCPNGKVRVMKLLSVDPQNYSDAPREAIRRILQEETGNALDKDGKVNSALIESIRMGTTVATNALLERKGAAMALVINKGFKDLLYIGNQARPNIFQLNIKRPEVLYKEVVEVDCRVIPALEDRCQLDKAGKNWKEVYGTTGEKMLVIKDIDEDAVRVDLQALKEKGIESIAVVLAHSYTYHDHEIRVGKIAESLGFTQVSLSHAVTSMVRMVPRGFTASADAYLTPHIREYVRSFSDGFTDSLKDANVLFMQSDGGLTPMNLFNGSRAILSGPAGGVIGYAMTSYQKETGLPVIGFDMGGTSTDVSRYAGSLEHVHEATTAGVTIQAPQLDINTVAAGGGSMLFFRSGLFVAGPESAGAEPGPACYRKGGPLAVTDANLLLGRLLPEYFPKIFGPDENEPLDRAATVTAFEKMTEDINAFLKQDGGNEMTTEEVAMGFINVANEAMCRPIRALTTARGHDAAQHALACFGGAGGQHACSVARRLGISTVLIHKYAGILSAYGMALAHIVHEAQEPSACLYSPENYQQLDRKLDVLSAVCKDKLLAQGIPASRIVLEPYLHLRYAGTDCALMVSPLPGGSATACSHGDFYTAFVNRYKNEFGFTLSERDVLVDDVRVRGVGLSAAHEHEGVPSGEGAPPPAEKTVKVYFEGGYQDTKIYLLEKLLAEQVVPGPAIIMDSLSTILVEPDCRAEITKHGDVKITIGSGQAKKVTTALDSIQLSIFSHRFMSIAEQMGRVLQRTSISVNIKERLDFSCALFGPTGGLVSNAPHIPVHLGAMQEAVQYQMKVRGDTLRPGDVLLANHPKAGGSHLPDLTVITPVFHGSDPRPIFFVASRGHHADIGGLTPGSMPPHSVSLTQEGAAFKSFLLVDKGAFNEKLLVEELMKPGNEPGCSGTRNLADNLSDLKAQVAANQRGIQLVGELIEEYGLEVVQAYMEHIQKNAELAVRDMLKEIARSAIAETGSAVLSAVEYMDNGTPISLTVTLDKDSGSALCDFTGTGVEVWGNLNAPRAITLSALIYCLRCMVGHDVPLNQGCLTPVSVVIPPGCILDPSEGAAVVGGNVLTSQRIVDVVLKAFQVCAASQGCMNNLTLGEADWGYYETVAGGSGAGPGWAGQGGVHTHMTNTRITDVEIVERRYPMLVTGFSLRAGSGGRGRWAGGEGVRRELVLRRAVRLSVLSERRALPPYGLRGGEAGARGLNLLERTDGRIINLGGKASVDAYPGDKYIMNSPGGGGYGPPAESSSDEQTDKQYSAFIERGSVYEYRSAQESV